jgi:hypothetical protein
MSRFGSVYANHHGMYEDLILDLVCLIQREGEKSLVPGPDLLTRDRTSAEIMFNYI